MSKLRSQLIGAWELISYTAYTPSDQNNVIHPMGDKAQGIIMSAQLQTPGAKEGDWEAIGKKYVAYTGHFWLDESGDEHGPLLIHEMRNSNMPRLVGDKQRRLIQIKDEHDGRYLILSTADPIRMGSDDRIPLVRWRRLEDNQATRAPESKLA